MTLENLNKNYMYKTDQIGFGRVEYWQVMKPNEKGQYIGDCEDYCLTLKKLIPQFKNWYLYFCNINGNWHCILYKNRDVIDCNIRSIVSFNNYCKIYKVSEFSKYNKFTIVSKVLVSKVLLWFRSLRS